MTNSTKMRGLLNKLNEAVNPEDVTYARAGATKAKTAAGDFNKITATLSDHTSGDFTKIAKKFDAIDDLNKQIESLRKEANDAIKVQIASLFKAEDSVYTRYIETKSLTIMMAKDQEESVTDVTTVNYKGFTDAIFELLDDDLQPIIENLLTAHTKVTAKTKAAQLGRVTVTNKKLGESTVVDKVKAFVDRVWRAVASKMSAYDSKLAQIKATYNV